jgi:antitoxin VapB
MGLADQLDDIAKRCAAHPVIDERSEDEILGYDEKGLPH